MIERADVKKNKDKVSASLAKNPLQSQREVAKDTWISLWATNRTIDKVVQSGTKDDRIINLTDKDFELMQLIQKRKFDRMKDEETPVNDSDVNNWDKTAQARYTIFRWDATDKDWGLKQMSEDKLNKVTDLLKKNGLT